MLENQADYDQELENEEAYNDTNQNIRTEDNLRPSYEELLKENQELKQKLEEKEAEIRNLGKENKINVSMLKYLHADSFWDLFRFSF